MTNHRALCIKLVKVRSPSASSPFRSASSSRALRVIGIQRIKARSPRFTLRSEVGTRVGARPTQGLPERSGGLGGFFRVVGRALVAQSETKKRENEKAISSRLEWSAAE